MEANKSLIPVIVALTIAIVGSSVLFGMDFSKTAVRNDGIRKISREALARAGAIATPTPPNE
jgi:hypothetical protein